MKKLLDTNNIVYTTVPIFIILMLTNISFKELMFAQQEINMY